MNDNFNFDQFVKERLGTYNAEVPDQIWDNIVAARRKSRPKAFWYSGNIVKLALWAGIIITALIGGYFIYHSTTDQKSISSNVAGRPESISKTDLTTSTPKQVSAVNSGAGSGAQDNSAIAKPVVPANAVGSLSKPAEMHAQPSTYLSLPDQPAKAFTSGLPVQKTHIFNSTSTIPGTSDADLAVSAEVGTPLIASNFGKVAGVMVSTSPFLINQANARELPKSNNLSTSNTKFVGCPNLERNAAGNKKYWEIYAGPDYVFNNFKTMGDTSSYNYLQKRKASTSFTSAFSTGIRYTRVFENGMSARAGVNYSQTNEKFSYVNPNELRFVTVITRRVVVRSPGDTLYLNDTLQYQQAGTHVKTTYNHYRNIDIPLVIGYELGNGKIHANINAGVIINVYSWYKGDILDTSYQPVTITTGKTTSNYQYRTNIGVGFLGSFSLYYKLTDRMHLLLEPYFRYNLSPMSKENLNLQEKYHTVGLRTGIRVDLP